ncbi:apolipoprotein N-acyltransferase [Pseudonocardia sp. KRD-184]|uniref:Apolipoprotein N-acyltransferase n=1 Tax=Pseudonocardia oceani TaxID=2792013 RepID=A0ABS6UJV5_9PSEU|nr:apolipoprotein N-acyltransferase [Pseudonocardia oceani]MBW0093783.1 apolipoprotein N-acyltransferase [Pseudonocardia oceani]MBW0100417.1 apolipoprotein N-acyltransferase [Pseudonocardia oceani]MBW0126015.1 apolipoprotein N-acyltransferase [Pseudonocardia oceani]MBW0132533.1 apolipoprotein N-acyltransferase [Pseudonocardia oceani]
MPESWVAALPAAVGTGPILPSTTARGVERPPARQRGARYGLWWPCAAAAAAGGLLYLSFPPRPLWWLAPLGFAVLGVVLAGRRARAGLGYGLLAGLGLFVPLLSWTGAYVGPLPWLVLAVLQAWFVAAAGAGIAAVSRLPGWPLWAAGVWVAGEAARSRVPFGGFPWGRVAFGQPDGVFAPLAALGGPALIGFAVALAGFGLATLVLPLAARPRRPARRTLRAAVWLLVAVVAGLAASPLVDAARPGDRLVTVAVVQGNVPRLGLDFNAQRAAVLGNHVRRTEQLAADVAAGRVAPPELVIWPENSADIDPLRNPDAAAAIDRAVAAIGVPVLIGAVESPPVGGLRNTAIRWEPGVGPTGTYVKRRIQPFGEYIPMRSVVRLFSDKVDRVQRDFTPGTEATVLQMGPAAVGIATCYEVAFDDTVTDTVRGGAQLLAVPANNATFGRTEMTYQQLAQSRIRAIEHGRTVLVAATSGVSAIITPDGTVQQQTGQFTPDALVAQVPLRSTTTPATGLGGVVEAVLAAIGAVAVVVAAVLAVAARATIRRDQGGRGRGRGRWA